MSDPKVGDVYVRKADRAACKVMIVNTSDVWLQPELTRGMFPVNHQQLAADYERQETVQKAVP